MKPILFDTSIAESIIERINKLSAVQQPRWGKLTLENMLYHLDRSLAVNMGEVVLERDVLGTIFRPISRMILLGKKPFPKNLHAPKSTLGNSSKSFEELRNELITRIQNYVEKGPSGLTKLPHNILGTITPEQSSYISYKTLRPSPEAIWCLMVIRKAEIKDNDQLVRLAALTPMQGTISICIERSPDFFALLNKKGSPHVIVTEEREKLIGCVSIIRERGIVGSKPVTIEYCCDLKVHPQHRNKKIATKLCYAMHDHLKVTQPDIVLSTVADGNNKVMPLFNGKSGLQGVTSTGRFYILQLVPRPLNRKSSYELIKTAEANKVTSLYQTYYKDYGLTRSLDSESLKECTHFCIEKDKQVVAALSLYNSSSLKQNVLVNIPWYYQAAVQLLKLGKKVFNTPYLPKRGEIIRILYVKAFAYANGHENDFIDLVEAASDHAYHNGYSFLSIWFHEKDELRKRFKRFRYFPFVAKGMAYVFDNKAELLQSIQGKKIYEDFSLI